jgi:hypothetical protein
MILPHSGKIAIGMHGCTLSGYIIITVFREIGFPVILKFISKDDIMYNPAEISSTQFLVIHF